MSASKEPIPSEEELQLNSDEAGKSFSKMLNESEINRNELAKKSKEALNPDAYQPTISLKKNIAGLNQQIAGLRSPPTLVTPDQFRIPSSPLGQSQQIPGFAFEEPIVPDATLNPLFVNAVEADKTPQEARQEEEAEKKTLEDEASVERSEDSESHGTFKSNQSQVIEKAISYEIDSEDEKVNAQDELEEEKALRKSATALVHKFSEDSGEKIHAGEHGALVKYTMSRKKTFGKMLAFLEGYRAHTFDSSVEVDKKLNELNLIVSQMNDKANMLNRAIKTFTYDSHSLVNEFQELFAKAHETAENVKSASRYEPYTLDPATGQLGEDNENLQKNIAISGNSSSKSVMNTVKIPSDERMVLPDVTKVQEKKLKQKVDVDHGKDAPASVPKGKAIKNHNELIAISQKLKLGLPEAVILAVNIESLNKKLLDRQVKNMGDLALSLQTVKGFKITLEELILNSF
uniref:Protein 2 n=1 Tax=Brassica virus 2_Inc TaxID=2977958 RepID=A0A9N7AAZ1_9RHAB|nr:TPA_asm: protein 2 [Brassica virus 2_Inc]